MVQCLKDFVWYTATGLPWRAHAVVLDRSVSHSVGTMCWAWLLAMHPWQFYPHNCRIRENFTLWGLYPLYGNCARFEEKTACMPAHSLNEKRTHVCCIYMLWPPLSMWSLYIPGKYDWPNYRNLSAKKYMLVFQILAALQTVYHCKLPPMKQAPGMSYGLPSVVFLECDITIAKCATSIAQIYANFVHIKMQEYKGRRVENLVPPLKQAWGMWLWTTYCPYLWYSNGLCSCSSPLGTGHSLTEEVVFLSNLLLWRN